MNSMKPLTTAVFFAMIAASRCAAMGDEASLLKTALDPHAGVVERTRAFLDLPAVATSRSLSAVAPLLSDPAWSDAARLVVEPLPGDAADQALLDALATARDDNVRAGLMTSLGRRRVERAVPAIAKFVASPQVAVAGAALNALGDIGSARAADVLLAPPAGAALKQAWADAALRGAEALRAGDSAKSLALYRAVKASGPPAQAAAARIGVARASSQPATEIAAALRSDDEPTRRAALAVIRAGDFGAQLTAAVGDVFRSLAAPVQVQALAVLYDRGDRAAAPIARRALGASEPTVRGAAARLLSIVGEPADAPALIQMMVGADEPAPSARLALARIPGPEVAAALLESFRKGAEVRVAALEVLVARGHRALLPELLKPELYAEESFRPIAANAVLTLGTGADLGRVLELHRALPAAQQAALEAALRRLAAKDPSPDVAAGVVSAAAEKRPVAEAAPLYTILAGIGGERARATLSGLAKSAEPEARRTAVRAFASWRDAAPAATLLAIAKSDADAGVRALAVSSATTLFTKSAFAGNSTAMPDLVPAAIKGLRETWLVAEHAPEKDAIVAALKSLKARAAIAAAEELEQQTPPSAR